MENNKPTGDDLSVAFRDGWFLGYIAALNEVKKRVRVTGAYTGEAVYSLMNEIKSNIPQPEATADAGREKNVDV